MPAKSPIKFGTSGWRGIIARDFTYANVELATQGICDYLKAEMRRKKSPIHKRKPVVILGHDTRFMGEDFTLAAAAVLSENGFTPLLCNRNAPTPVISHTIRDLKAVGGINMTASHNPSEYQGLKFSNFLGAAAPPETTQKVEAAVQKRFEKGWSFKPKAAAPDFKRIDPMPSYFKQIKRFIDFKAIQKGKLKVAIQLMNGTGSGYVDTALEGAGAKVIRFNAEPDPTFGGNPHPEPDAEGMKEVSACVKSGKANLGLGVDCDADRFGIVDKDGTWITPNQVLALALYHLKKNRKWTGAAVRTVPTSHQVDGVAEMLGVKLHETPVGFKYIGALMESEPIIVGGEESGGMSVKGHIPEKDGILACLLMAELVAVEKKTLKAIIAEISKTTGEYFTERINIRVQETEKAAIIKKLSAGADKVGTRKVEEFITKDGFKFLLPGGEWIAFRASGTEPVFRCYIEAKSEKALKSLRTAAKKLLA